MKKNQTMQGTLSKFFGKKNANSNTTSLYATNPPWIFTQDAREEGTRDLGECTAGRASGAEPPGGSRQRCPVPGSGRSARLGAEGQGHVGTCEPAGKELPGTGGGAAARLSGQGPWGGGMGWGKRCADGGDPPHSEGGDLCGPRI